jgi:hypothetical protein
MAQTENAGKGLPAQDPEEFGWNFHKGPLLFAAILTVIFYLAVFWLASTKAETDRSPTIPESAVPSEPGT